MSLKVVTSTTRAPECTCKAAGCRNLCGTLASRAGCRHPDADAASATSDKIRCMLIDKATYVSENLHVLSVLTQCLAQKVIEPARSAYSKRFGGEAPSVEFDSEDCLAPPPKSGDKSDEFASCSGGIVVRVHLCCCPCFRSRCCSFRYLLSSVAQPISGPRCWHKLRTQLIVPEHLPLPSLHLVIARRLHSLQCCVCSTRCTEHVLQFVMSGNPAGKVREILRIHVLFGLKKGFIESTGACVLLVRR